MTPETAAAYSLLNAEAVRDRAQRMLALGLDDKLPNFRVDLGRLDDAVDFVLSVLKKNYPALDVPFHSRWRHFVTHGVDRHAGLAEDFADKTEQARSDFDLAILSVLLDAGVGPQWRYWDADNRRILPALRDLAVASINLFARGDFSSRRGDGANQLRVDADALTNLETATLRDGFQVTDDNPLVGIEGRADLLRSLGRLVSQRPEIFALQRFTATRRIFRSSRRQSQWHHNFGAAHTVRIAAAIRTDLAVAADAWRRAARRLLATPVVAHC